MSDDQAQRAIQQLYEDTSARDELSDDEANVLLAWGEAQIKDLAGRSLDDTAFDDAFAHLRGVMKNINRYTGQRTYATPDDLLALLNELAAEAQSLGVNVQAQELAIPQAQAADNNIALIKALTALVTPGANASAQAQTVATKSPVPPAASAPTAPTENITSKTPESPAVPVEKPDNSNDDPPEKPNLFDQIKKLF
jgi:hypothetical protein